MALRTARLEAGAVLDAGCHNVTLHHRVRGCAVHADPRSPTIRPTCDGRDCAAGNNIRTGLIPHERIFITVVMKNAFSVYCGARLAQLHLPQQLSTRYLINSLQAVDMSTTS